MSATIKPVQERLTDMERALLAECEDAIRRGARAFVTMGKALVTVRDSRLYKQDHATFDAYCQAEWGLTRSRAYQIIEAADVALELSQNCDTLPANESVAREVARSTDPDATWTEAIQTHGEKPTAAQVREVVRGLASPEALDKDPRYLAVEDAVAILDKMPAADMILWPSEPYDVAQTDAAVLWMRRHWPAILDSWRQHKRELARVRKEAKATGLRAVA